MANAAPNPNPRLDGTQPQPHVAGGEDHGEGGALAPQQAASVQVNIGHNTYTNTINAQSGQYAEEIAEMVRRQIEEHDRAASDVGYAAALGMARSEGRRGDRDKMRQSPPLFRCPICPKWASGSHSSVV